MEGNQVWQVLALNEDTCRWEVVQEKETLGEAEKWILENKTEGVLEGKTRALRRITTSIQ